MFTTDYRKAQRVTSALETGMVTINDFGLLATVQSLPFGGVKVGRHARRLIRS